MRYQNNKKHGAQKSASMNFFMKFLMKIKFPSPGIISLSGNLVLNIGIGMFREDIRHLRPYLGEKLIGCKVRLLPLLHFDP